MFSHHLGGVIVPRVHCLRITVGSGIPFFGESGERASLAQFWSGKLPQIQSVSMLALRHGHKRCDAEPAKRVRRNDLAEEPNRGREAALRIGTNASNRASGERRTIRATMSPWSACLTGVWGADSPKLRREAPDHQSWRQRRLRFFWR